MTRLIQHTAQTRKAFPILTLREREDSLKVADGTLIVTREEHFNCGSSIITTLTIDMADHVQLERERSMNFPIDADEKEVLQDTVDAMLAKQLRLSAMPMIANPARGLELGVDHMIATAERQMATVYRIQ